MEVRQMKNMIVLKNLPSNMVEEAFVVLKENRKICKPEMADKKKGKEIIEKQETREACIVKEAEMIITEYLFKMNQRQDETGKKQQQKLLQKYKKMKTATIFFMMFSILSTIVILFS